jgi:Periplasmic binding protein
VRDDGRDPAAALAETRRLAREERVDAIVPIETTRFTDDGTLADARVPAFGWGIAGGFCGNRWAFAITGCRAPLLPRRVPSIWGSLVATVLRTRGVRQPTAAIVIEAVAVPRSLDELRAVVEGAGIRVNYAEAVLGTGERAAADVDRIADTLLGSGRRPPDAVFVVAGFAAVGALQDALRVRGFTGVATNLVQYSPALVASARGAYILTEFATPEAAAGDASMREILEQIAALTPDAVTPSMIAGWLSADFWVRAVRAAGRNPTPAQIARAASRLRFRVAGTVGPTDYPAAFVRPTSCGQLVTSDGSAFTIAAPYRCSGYVRVQ